MVNHLGAAVNFKKKLTNNSGNVTDERLVSKRKLSDISKPVNALESEVFCYE